MCFAVKVLLTITCSHARGMDAFKLMKELRLNYEQEVHYLPKKTGLSLIASSVQVRPLWFFKHRGVSAYFKRHHFAFQDDSRISAKSRDARVEDLWSLTSFFGYSTQTFVLAVNLLDRFLAMMRVRWSRLQHKHVQALLLSCCARAPHSHCCQTCLPLDPTQAPVVRQPQLPPHGSQSDRGGVQPHALRRAHSHRTVPLHSVGPGAHGEDCRREAQLQIQSRHCLNLPALVPSAHAVALHRQVRPADPLAVSVACPACSQPRARRLRSPQSENKAKSWCCVT